ncbi:MAG: late competence development ComFB family protein [Cyanobacteria bacterium P01_A01_bin.45]
MQNVVYPSPNSSKQVSKRKIFTKNYQNVMETVVIEEVEEQLETLSPNAKKHIKAYDITAYALNRLPALYATGKRGWHRQYNRGKKDLYTEIKRVVKEALIAVQKDPLRTDRLIDSQEERVAYMALQEVRWLLKRNDISWENLAIVLEETLSNALDNKTVSWRVSSVDEQEPESSSPEELKEIFDWDSHPHYQGD